MKTCTDAFSGDKTVRYGFVDGRVRCLCRDESEQRSGIPKRAFLGLTFHRDEMEEAGGLVDVRCPWGATKRWEVKQTPRFYDVRLSVL